MGSKDRFTAVRKEKKSFSRRYSQINAEKDKTNNEGLMTDN
jgi:hypothetical protein